MPRDAGHRKLGEILLEHGALTEEKLKKALGEQEARGGLLGEVLLHLGYVTEEDIVIALASQFNFPYLPIDNFAINPQAIKSVSADIVRNFICIPIDQIQNILTIVMSDPSNTNAVKAIEEFSGCSVQPFVATVTEIKNAIRKHYGITLPGDGKAETNVSQITFRHAREKSQSDSGNNPGEK